MTRRRSVSPGWTQTIFTARDCPHGVDGPRVSIAWLTSRSVRCGRPPAAALSHRQRLFVRFSTSSYSMLSLAVSSLAGCTRLDRIPIVPTV